MKYLSVIVLFLASISSPRLAQGEPPPVTPQELISEGVSLHDAGKFDDAIRRYTRALEIEPGNALALYELANTYAATRQYDLCEANARRGLKKPGPLEGPLFAVAGTCLSSAGKTREALHTFEEGLAKHPNDPALNFNIAITLLQDGRPQPAVPHLQRVIEAKPFYSSPYLRLGEIYANEGRSVEGIWFLMRFVSLELNSGRAVSASAKVFELLTSGVSTNSEKGVTITVGPNMEKTLDEFASLEFARALAATSIYLEEAQAQPKALRFVSALDSFVEMGTRWPGERRASRSLETLFGGELPHQSSSSRRRELWNVSGMSWPPGLDSMVPMNGLRRTLKR